MRVLRNEDGGSKRNKRRKNKKKNGKNILLKSKETSALDKMTCVMTLSEEDINTAIKLPFLRVNGVLYDTPVAQFEKFIREKTFGTVKVTLRKAKDQTPPSPPGSINILAEDRENLIEYIKEFKPSQATHPDLFLHLERTDCGCKFDFKTEEDIPEETLVCEHENRVIYYTGPAEDNESNEGGES